MDITITYRQPGRPFAHGTQLEVHVADSPTGKAAIMAAVEAALALHAAVEDNTALILRAREEVDEARNERNAALSELDQVRAALEARGDDA